MTDVLRGLEHVFEENIMTMLLTDNSAFERGTDAILQFFTVVQAQSIVSFQGDDSIRNRIEELAEKATEGMLTGEERSEYEGYVRANKFMAIFQAKARKFLASNPK